MSHTKRSFTFQNYLLGVKRALPAEPVHRAERLRRAKRAVSNLQFASWALLCFFFLPFFDWEFSFFSFYFLPLFDWEFPFFSFFAFSLIGNFPSLPFCFRGYYSVETVSVSTTTTKINLFDFLFGCFFLKCVVPLCPNSQAVVHEVCMSCEFCLSRLLLLG